MPRMIECYHCNGNGMSSNECGDLVQCLWCNGSGTTEDRRRPTANDRAVERIKTIADLDGTVHARTVHMIIREEQGADDAV